MCECGSVIVIRRFIRKGLPLSYAVTYGTHRAEFVQSAGGAQHLDDLSRTANRGR